MKEKPILVSLILAVFLLLGVAGVLTSILLKMAIPATSTDADQPAAVPPIDRTPPAVASVDIDLPAGPAALSPGQRTSGAPLPAELPPSPVPGLSPLTQDTPVTPVPSGAIGRIVLARGTVSATDPAQRRRPLAVDSPVFTRDTLDTGPAARLSIEFVDGTTIFQGENTSLTLDEYVYDTSRKAAEPRFALRLFSGVCRLISGLIAGDHSQERLRVKTRMASIGIRGCELAFRSDKTQDDIFVLALGTNESVRIESTFSGKPLNNVATGLPLPVEPADLKIVEINDSRSHVSLAQGREPRQSTLSPDKLRQLSAETSHLTPSRHELIQKPDGALIVIPPASQQPPPGETGNPK